VLKKSIDEERKRAKDKGDFDPTKLLRSRHVAEAFRKGDELTHRVVRETAEMLGTAIAGVVTLLSLPHVVLGGGFTEALGEPWVREVRVAVRERVFPHELRKVEVVGTALRDNAGIVGAALLARENL
jgi:glucokinase